MTYGNFKDLPKRTASDKVLHVNHLILKNTQNMMDLNVDLLQWFKNFLTKSLLLRVHG